MRIGLDAIAMQSPDHARRGIGRYARNLIAALQALPGDQEFVLYIHENMPTQWLCETPRAEVRTIAVEPERGDRCPSSRMDRLVRENPDDLDVLLLLSPFEPWSGYTPPGPRGRPAVAAVVYDLIPLIFPEIYLFQKHRRAWYDRCLRALKRCDAILTISEATRADCLARLALPERRVTNIGTASDGDFFVPDRGSSEATETLKELGIDRPFVFCVGGRDPRKNLWGLIDAFAILPDELRNAHQLVLTFALYSDDELRVREYVEARGVTGSLVLTDDVSDRVLRTLYQSCAVFVFPSIYEGFGLPILEAMHCGAVVIAGDNSSQPEVTGDAALLVNAAETRDIADKLNRVLGCPEEFAPLREKAVERASRFSWERTASLAMGSLAGLVESRPIRRTRATRPRIAFFSPFPPARSGVADYSQSLVEELSRTYIVDRYCVETALPEPAWDAHGGSTADARVFDRVAAYRDYRGVVYQMGNSYHHRFLYPYLLRYPGVTTLHDFCLAGFHLGFGQDAGRRREHFAEELEYADPEHAREMMAAFDRLGDDNEAIVAACSSAGATLNRRIFERSRRVIVHSPWCLKRLGERRPELADRVAVIPLGSRTRAGLRREKAGDSRQVRPRGQRAGDRGLWLRASRQDERRERDGVRRGGPVPPVGRAAFRGAGSRRRRGSQACRGGRSAAPSSIPRAAIRVRFRRPRRHHRHRPQPPKAAHERRDLGRAPRPPAARSRHDRDRRGHVFRLSRRHHPQGALGFRRDGRAVASLHGPGTGPIKTGSVGARGDRARECPSRLVARGRAVCGSDRVLLRRAAFEGIVSGRTGAILA